jgi:hypothetical protein
MSSLFLAHHRSRVMTAIVCVSWMLLLCTGAVLPTFAIKYTYETKYVDVPVSN